jgi:acyl-ACP thioesterase
VSAIDATDAAERPLVHEARYRVRFDEAGPDGRLRTSGLMRYAQDVAWQHSTALGFGRDWYLERGLTWLVRSAELEVLEPIPMGVDVVAETRVLGQKRVWARRRGEFRDDAGRRLAWVHTDWVMIDARGALTRIPGVFGDAFRIPEATGQISRVALPPSPSDAARRSFAVRPHELDPMDHVNNAVYLDWLEDAVLAAAGHASVELTAVPRRYSLEYAAAADAGMALSDAAWRDDGVWRYRLTGTDGADVFRAAIDPPGGA